MIHEQIERDRTTTDEKIDKLADAVKVLLDFHEEEFKQKALQAEADKLVAEQRAAEEEAAQLRRGQRVSCTNWQQVVQFVAEHTGGYVLEGVHPREYPVEVTVKPKEDGYWYVEFAYEAGWSATGGYVLEGVHPDDTYRLTSAGPLVKIITDEGLGYKFGPPMNSFGNFLKRLFC